MAKGRTEAGIASDRLTQAGLVRMELVPLPPAATPFVTTFFRVWCDQTKIRDVQPSSLGIIKIMARGAGTIRFVEGASDPSHPLSLLTPAPAASTFEIAGPWDGFGAMLSPVGWAALTGLSAARHSNRLHPLEKIAPAPLVEAAQGVLRDYDRIDDAEKAERLTAGILAAARPLRPGHVEFITKVAAWLARSLSPRLDELVADSGLGPRQVQRLCDRYFGLPPRSLARKYRALRAAVLLSRPQLTAEEQSAIEDHFYDQSHMIREIRLFAGRTPARIADPDTPYLSAFMDLRDFPGGGNRMAPIPADLRA